METTLHMVLQMISTDGSILLARTAQGWQEPLMDARKRASFLKKQFKKEEKQLQLAHDKRHNKRSRGVEAGACAWLANDRKQDRLRQKQYEIADRKQRGRMERLDRPQSRHQVETALTHSDYTQVTSATSHSHETATTNVNSAATGANKEPLGSSRDRARAAKRDVLGSSRDRGIFRIG